MSSEKKEGSIWDTIQVLLMLYFLAKAIRALYVDVPSFLYLLIFERRRLLYDRGSASVAWAPLWLAILFISQAFLVFTFAFFLSIIPFVLISILISWAIVFWSKASQRHLELGDAESIAYYEYRRKEVTANLLQLKLAHPEKSQMLPKNRAEFVAQRRINLDDINFRCKEYAWFNFRTENDLWAEDNLNSMYAVKLENLVKNTPIYKLDALDVSDHRIDHLADFWHLRSGEDKGDVILAIVSDPIRSSYDPCMGESKSLICWLDDSLLPRHSEDKYCKKKYEQGELLKSWTERNDRQRQIQLELNERRKNENKMERNSEFLKENSSPEKLASIETAQREKEELKARTKKAFELQYRTEQKNRRVQLKKKYKADA